MTNLEDFILDETIIGIIDQNGLPKEISLRQSLEMFRKQELSKDKELGITRNRIPFTFIPLPDKPETPNCMSLSEAIKNIPVFNLSPDNQNQAIWMRSVQLYYQAKAIVLPNKIFKLISDPTQPGGSVQKMLPPQTLNNLDLETNAEKALYDLLKAGESEIIAWAKSEDIDYPFSNFEELFIHILKAKFQIDIQEESFGLKPSWTNKREQKEHYRGWIKYLNDHDLDEKSEKRYREILMDMEWEGYPLLALKSKKTDKKLGKLWQSYLKTHRVLIEIIDTKIYWNNGIPHKNKNTNKRLPIKATVSKQGSFEWNWP
jgi:hypothetical protein